MAPDPESGRSRAIPADLRRQLRRAYNASVLTTMASKGVTGQPCPGLTSHDGDVPGGCKGAVAYLRYALRVKPDGAPVCAAFGRCPNCGAVAVVEIDLPRVL